MSKHKAGDTLTADRDRHIEILGDANAFLDINGQLNVVYPVRVTGVAKAGKSHFAVYSDRELEDFGYQKDAAAVALPNRGAGHYRRASEDVLNCNPVAFCTIDPGEQHVKVALAVATRRAGLYRRREHSGAENLNAARYYSVDPGGEYEQVFVVADGAPENLPRHSTLEGPADD